MSQLGWYAVLSQDCDIVRSMDVEPCLVICPFAAVPDAEWQALRSGPYSPREFPYPRPARVQLPEGTAAVANARFVTSVEKTALLTPSFSRVTPLTAALRVRFREWIARRFARAPHPDARQEHVLDPCGHRISELAKRGRTKTGGRSRAQMLVLMADEWYVAPGEQLIAVQLVVTAAAAQGVGLWDTGASDFNRAGIEQARKELQNDLGRRMTPGLGYSLTIEVHTLDRVSAQTYRTWSPWTWDSGSAWSGAPEEHADVAAVTDE